MGRAGECDGEGRGGGEGENVRIFLLSALGHADGFSFFSFPFFLGLTGHERAHDVEA